jgi:hypothetical protein
VRLIHFAAVCFLAAGTALAASNDEIEVYDDAINRPGETGLDVHTNYVVSGVRTPAWQGDDPANHSFRVTPEFSRGLPGNFEAGAYLPLFLRDGNGTGYIEGAKARLKYLSAPADSAFFWGINGEIGRVSLRSAEQNWNLEVRPILGYRFGKIKVSVNPILDWGISGNGNNVPVFAPAARAVYALGQDLSVGLEHYAVLGKTNAILPQEQQSQVTYAVLDTEVAKHSVEFGIGKGWTGNSDPWTIKTIIGSSF